MKHFSFLQHTYKQPWQSLQSMNSKQMIWIISSTVLYIITSIVISLPALLYIITRIVIYQYQHYRTSLPALSYMSCKPKIFRPAFKTVTVVLVKIKAFKTFKYL